MAGYLGEQTKSEDEAAPRGTNTRDKHSRAGQSEEEEAGDRGSDPVCITYGTSTPTAPRHLGRYLGTHSSPGPETGRVGKASKLSGKRPSWPGAGPEVACLTTRSARVKYPVCA